MDRDYLLRKLTVGLEVAEKEGISREQLPEFLTQDIWNNWEMVELAQRQKMSDLALKPFRRESHPKQIMNPK